MKRIITVIALTLTTFSYSQIAKDKQLHYIAGVAIGGIANTATFLITKDEKKAFIIGLGASIGAGIAKELYDEYSYGGWDNKDLIFTILGGVSINIPLTMIEGVLKERSINKEL